MNANGVASKVAILRVGPRTGRRWLVHRHKDAKNCGGSIRTTDTPWGGMDHVPIVGRVISGKMVRENQPLYSPRATREAIANAICHRDYTIPGGAVAVAMYDEAQGSEETGPKLVLSMSQVRSLSICLRSPAIRNPSTCCWRSKGKPIGRASATPCYVRYWRRRRMKF